VDALKTEESIEMVNFRSRILMWGLAAGLTVVADIQAQVVNSQSSSEVSAQALNIRNLLSRFDSDGDGKLSVLERARVRQFIQKQNVQREVETSNRTQWQEVVQRYDADGDGVLNATERQAALNTIRELAVRQPQKVSIENELIERLDVNRDGRVDDVERRLLTMQVETLRESVDGEPASTDMPSHGTRRTLEREALIQRFDLNRDGQIDAEERVLARQIILEGKLSTPDGDTPSHP
jgi:Ca2+-binding EF-hand superfamily protein